MESKVERGVLSSQGCSVCDGAVIRQSWESRGEQGDGERDRRAGTGHSPLVLDKISLRQGQATQRERRCRKWNKARAAGNSLDVWVTSLSWVSWWKVWS